MRYLIVSIIAIATGSTSYFFMNWAINTPSMASPLITVLALFAVGLACAATEFIKNEPLKVAILLGLIIGTIGAFVPYL
jgi:hypothetical protein